MGINIDFSGMGQRRREKRQRSAALLDTYLKDNPDITLAEAQEAMDQVDQTGELPDTFSTGRKLSSIRGKRKAYFNQNKDTGLLEPVDMGEDVSSGRADPTILGFNPGKRGGADDENAPGRLITQNEDGTFGYVNPQGQEVPLGSGGGFPGITKRDRIVQKPRTPMARAPGETPAQKAARDTIQKYMAAVDDYADPADMPEALTKNMKSAAQALGMTVDDVTDVIKKRGAIAKFFGMKDVTRTTPVIRYAAGSPAAAGGGADEGGETGDAGAADEGGQGDGGAPARGPAMAAAGGRGGYGSEEDVRAAYRSGKITKEKALRLLGY